jgi:hypothetical protein
MTAGGVSISSQTGEAGGQKKFWRHHIQTWQGSGLSQRAYCQKNNLKEYRFSHWKRRLVMDDGSGRFVRLPVPSHLPVPINRGVLHIFSPNGFRVDVEEGFDPDLLKKLLAVLGEVSHAM